MLGFVPQPNLQDILKFKNWLGIIWCGIAALIATTIESLIGATLQSKWTWLTNEVANGINTAIGALVAILLNFLNYY